MIFKFFPKFTFWIMLLFDEVRLTRCQIVQFASLITAPGFIEHTKAVTGGKLVGKD